MHSSFQTNEISVTAFVVIVLLLLFKLTFFWLDEICNKNLKIFEICPITYCMVNYFIYVLLMNARNAIFDKCQM